MKPSFHVKHPKGPFDDPSLYVRVLREGRALMFDLGFTTDLSPRDILKTTDVFVSHTHVDHFIGFDNVLRVSLKKEGPLRLYGPEGFIGCVEGKIGGYTWNLIRDYPLVIEALEVSGGHTKKAVFRAENFFQREDLDPEEFSGILMQNSCYAVSAVVLDHQIPCLAFSLEEDYHININKARLEDMKLPVGPWLAELKTAIRNNEEGRNFSVSGRTLSFHELRGVADITRGQKLSYVVDAAGSEENIEKIVGLVKGSDVLYIESYFLEEDRDRARERYHLTAGDAGRIAREAGVGRLETIHYSPRYMDDPERIVQEAEDEFRK